MLNILRSSSDYSFVCKKTKDKCVLVYVCLCYSIPTGCSGQCDEASDALVYFFMYWQLQREQKQQLEIAQLKQELEARRAEVTSAQSALHSKETVAGFLLIDCWHAHTHIHYLNNKFNPWPLVQCIPLSFMVMIHLSYLCGSLSIATIFKQGAYINIYIFTDGWHTMAIKKSTPQ